MPGEVLVTGATGFIGAHLSARLLDDGARLTVVTRRADAAAALAACGARVVVADLVDRARLLAETGDRPWDAIVHLGANQSATGDEMRRVNVGGTANVLRVAETSGARHVVFASSIEAQGPGGDDEIPLDEDRPCRPPTPYGQSKGDGEAQVTAFAERTGVPALVARIGNPYGAGGVGFVLPFLRALFMNDALAQALPCVANRLLQPIYVDDLVEAFMGGLRARLSGVYNFTGSEPATLGAWVTALADVLGVGDLARERLAHADGGPEPDAAVGRVPEVAYYLAGEGERVHRAYSDAKLRAAIGDYQRHDLRRGLTATLLWLQRVGALDSLLSGPTNHEDTRPASKAPFMFWIRDQMRARRFGVQALADRVGIDADDVSAWFHGVAVPDSETCQRLGHALGLPREQILAAARRV